MDANHIKIWIGIVQSLITMAGLLLGGLWAWTRFVLERGLMPPSQMDISLRVLGSFQSSTLIEIGVEIANKGSSALIVCDLRARLRYIDEIDKVEVADTQPDKGTFGRVNFPHAGVINGIGAEKRTLKDSRTSEDIILGSGEFLIVPYDTFVQPGVAQLYTFVTALPNTSMYLLARSSFRYQLRPSKMQLRILRVSRKLGLLQYSLNHVRVPHTVERTFKIENEQPAANTSPQPNPRQSTSPA